MELKSYPVKFLGIDEETEAVRDYVSEGYPASEPADDREEGQQAVQEGAQTWEDAGLESPMSPVSVSASQTNMEFEQGGCVPVTHPTRHGK